MKEPTLSEVMTFVSEQFGSLHDVIAELREGQKKHDNDIEEIKGSLRPHFVAVDADAATLVLHDRRLTHVEKKLGTVSGT